MAAPARTADSKSERGAASWLKAKPILVAFALFAIAAFTGAYFALDGDSGWKEFVQQLIPNVVVGLAAFLVVNYLLFHERLDTLEGVSGHLVKRVQDVIVAQERTRRIYRDAFDPSLDWEELFSASSSITIVGRYMDQWVVQLFELFVHFFRRGGVLTVVLTDPADDVLVTIAARQSFTAGQPDPAVTRGRIERSIRKLEEAYAASQVGSSAAAKLAELRLLITDQVVNQWIARFDHHVVVGSISHWPSDLHRPPVQLFDLRSEPTYAAFLDHEIGQFVRRGTQARDTPRP